MLIALVLSALGCLAIIVIGIRFLTMPERATRDFGVPANNLMASNRCSTS
ncbi:hypothetical protein [Micrococcus luteus]|nr:hypothetical protein [Micrococcus luteus]